MEMVHYYLFECGKGRVGYDWFSHLQETEWYDPKALYVAMWDSENQSYGVYELHPA